VKFSVFFELAPFLRAPVVGRCLAGTARESDAKEAAFWRAICTEDSFWTGKVQFYYCAASRVVEK
jgi:hypothetical protein